ncbi:bifunctional 4-hydroxy-2-oxoglutarate aldolase/2-dehydro-3-deoxy-phosphogluconate aldolase [Hymenobacter sp. ASUV-10]|uniref:Bifunctional 4-hydroxy-2-oxoglutarate aldolase/2-dehydro-3-deoxy-phosphogluconate aldolase n=1 Tax=Hymenobacter aranciens TaxID=3063996 RepID=A0ABT9B8E2_9BACT|nr:bifunctional 4-hydroxy-2-oxoglutarate aldolase/2-dehydro-3-deoxy-phosphogluconate aldolase [Hymenobacter sp. ASUV-10]MDO7874530.1 bifunctional 4-hydroxy-2-oxoglutarate aldolase/2-dehydro-3-deoxy-phosphogluconate aldolase [Hymenobacter sp. ASUV-10]
MPRFSSADALAIVLQHPIVPVFYHAEAAYATRILQACYAGGLRVFEFTNRGPEALAVFTELAAVVRQQLPELLLGIGTIYTAAQAEEFIAAGADFVVQPVTTADVAAVCQAHELPWLPGALTVNEIYQASQLGASIVKIFPGNLVGPDYIKALRGPMPQVKLMVTGGVEPTQASLGAWFGAGVNVVGMGSQLFKNVDDTAAFTALLRQLLGWARG